MPMESGVRLGQYEIAAKLGEGAMGEVYRAHDTRLGRDVAIKILPAEFAQSADRRRRFEQEWRAAAALAHANIVALYDAGDQDGVSYIVSELVEGELLRDLIRRGPVPVRRTLDLVAQVADGLSAAHAAGVVHRDLKPENIMVTRDGRVKILDFGLARYQPHSPSAPAATMTVTQPGMVMGTVGYMSPEQVTGYPAGPQSDIFSLGIITFEMLTGKLAFERTTSVETMSAILRDEPADLPAGVPPAAAQIVVRCLEKEPSRRFQSASDLAFALRGAASPTSVSGTMPRLQAPRRRFVLPAAVAVLAVLLAFALFALIAAPRGVHLESYRYTPLATESKEQDTPVWSPDGKSLAYVRGVINAPNEIMVRNLDSLVPVLVARADARSLFWSPDGTRLNYVIDTGVWSMSRAGGEANVVLKGDYLDAAPSPDGKALVLWLRRGEQHQKEPKLWISSPPGAPPRKYEPVLFEEEGSFNPVYLRFAPDGRKILLTKPTAMGPEVWLLPYPDGAATKGKARRLFGSMLAGAEWPPSFSWMPDSQHVVMAFSTPGHPQPQLWMAHVEDQELDAITADEGIKARPAVSPDGKKIAYTSWLQNFDIVEIPVAGGPVHPLLATSRYESFPAWSPLAPLLAYVTNRSGQQEIWVRNTQDGSDRPLVTQRDFPDDDTLALWTLAVSPDGTRLAYTRNSTKHLGAIWVSPLAGGTPVAIAKSDDFEFGPAWSPDGNWLTFHSSAGGLMKVRVGGTDPPVLVRQGSCRNPAQWSPDGQWLACTEDDGVLLLSPDCKTTRKVGTRKAAVAWSSDSRQLYALTPGEGPQWLLDSIDVASGAERTISDIGSQYLFSSTNGNSFSLSLSPDHKSLAASVLNYQGDVWMLEGFAQPRGWLGHLWPFGH
jgi:serine/threonine protein kinase/Tol biopolymer transport system component